MCSFRVLKLVPRILIGGAPNKAAQFRLEAEAEALESNAFVVLCLHKFVHCTVHVLLLCSVLLFRMASRALAELADADGARDWRAAYNRQLGNLIQKRLFYLQVRLRLHLLIHLHFHSRHFDCE